MAENIPSQKKKSSDIPFKALTYSFIEEYYHFLRVENKFKISTTVGYVVFFRKLVRNAVNQGILFRDPFDGFVPEERIREHKTLTRKELDKIMKFEIDPTLKRSISRDIFVFACYTNLEDKKQRKANHGNGLIVRNERPLVALSV